MPKVTLSGNGVGEQSFELEHAQNLLDLQKKVPPPSWELKDAKYELVNGKITEKKKS